MVRLSDAQRRALTAGPFIGPRPGSNFWPYVELITRRGERHDGEDLDALIRLGLLYGEPIDRPPYVVPAGVNGLPEEIECGHLYRLTEAGRRALAEDAPAAPDGGER